MSGKGSTATQGARPGIERSALKEWAVLVDAMAGGEIIAPQIHVIAARVKRLTVPAQLPEIRRYLGCVSWVQLEEDVDVDGAIPVVADSEFQGRLIALADALGTPTGGPRPPPAE